MRLTDLPDNIRGLEAQFRSFNQTDTYSQVPIIDRWEHVLRWIPVMTTRTVLGDLSDIVKEAEHTWTGSRLRAAYDMCLLRGGFVDCLRNGSIIPPHYHDMQVAQTQIWVDRLTPRFQATQRAKRRDTRIRGATVKPPTALLTIH